MPATDAERPARAEALSRAEPVRRTAPDHGAGRRGRTAGHGRDLRRPWIVHDRNEDRLLEQRGHEVATVAESSVGGLQGQLWPRPASRPRPATTARCSGSSWSHSSGPTAGSCRRRCGRSARAIRSRAIVVGAAPALARQSAAAKRAFLQSVPRRHDAQHPRPPRRRRPATRLRVRDPGRAVGRLRRSCAAEEPARPHRVRLRVRRPRLHALPRDATDPVTPARLELGPRARGQRTATETVPFGDSQILLVVSPRGRARR